MTANTSNASKLPGRRMSIPLIIIMLIIGIFTAIFVYKNFFDPHRPNEDVQVNEKNEKSGDQTRARPLPPPDTPN